MKAGGYHPEILNPFFNIPKWVPNVNENDSGARTEFDLVALILKNKFVSLPQSAEHLSIINNA